jgi:hypothetical protein
MSKTNSKDDNGVEAGAVGKRREATRMERETQRLDRLLNALESKLEDAKFKPSVGDFVRLLQLRKEMEEERPREITVTWVEPSEEENAPV